MRAHERGWAATISWLIDWSDNWFILSVMFQAKMSIIYWFQLLKWNNLLLFFVIYDSKWWVFWTVGWTNKSLWSMGKCDEHFQQFFWHMNIIVRGSPKGDTLPTFSCSWRLWAPTPIPGKWPVSFFGAAFISDCWVEGNTPPSVCLNKAAQHGDNRRRSLEFSVEGQSRYCWHRPVCVDEQTFLHGALCGYLL